MHSVPPSGLPEIDMARRTIPVLGLLLFFFLAAAVSAQEGTVTDDEVNDVAKDVFCPVCESTPLDVCPTQACADWRELIRVQLAEGKTKEEIHEYFARQYGDGVLADPPKRGFNLILWILPIVAVLGGGVFFWRYLTGLRASATPAVAAPVAVVEPGETASLGQVETSLAQKDDTDYLNQVEEELQNL
jgi:cytochrome c-type biogenesis protein CcmH